MESATAGVRHPVIMIILCKLECCTDYAVAMRDTWISNELCPIKQKKNSLAEQAGPAGTRSANSF